MKTVRLSLFIVAILTSLVACSKKPEVTATIKVGTILGLTGENAAYGIKMQRGLTVALADINQHGSSRFELVVEDSQWQPKQGISAYRKMHDLQGIRHFTAICGSKIALAICEVSRDDDIVIVDAISGAPKLTADGGPKYFRVYASDAMAGANNVNWALDEGAKSFAIVYVEDEWGASYKDAIVTALKHKGLDASVVPVAVNANEFRGEVKRVMDAQPDAVFAVVYANLAVPIVQQLSSLGFSGRIYGGDNLSSTDFAVAGESVVDGVRLSIPAEAKSPLFDKFAAAYRAKYSEDPDAFAMKSYDAFQLLAHAIRQTDGTASAVVNYLREMPPYEGVTGSLSFDKNGDLRHQIYHRVVYSRGKLVPFDAKNP